ncbi:hypothetical protein HanPI659440_Chr02g0046071 [Helianthus annuus]|nr:hypothetical protein HanIR_Chr02g0068561 [Helianthus annuus]KAJ0618499.1 hypothetical protein HanHA89_Chr02g0054031 [Helianthus annuus]KAJ0805121.1 hypothetical protein HanPI659440_Chr02g0046071 [Helianthus annuus]
MNDGGEPQLNFKVGGFRRSQLRILGFFIFISRREKGSWPEAGKGDHNALSLLEFSF